MCDAEFGMHVVDHVYFFLADFFFDLLITAPRMGLLFFWLYRDRRIYPVLRQADDPYIEIV